MDGVTKVVGEILVSLRGDYGATFNGDINIKNSTLLAYKSYNTSRGQSVSTEPYYSSVTLIKSGYSTSNSGYNASDTSGAYWLWDFGYTSYMPRNVVVDNFTTPASKSYLFNDLPDKIFTKSYVDGEAVTKNTVKYPYVITDSVTYKNMKSAIPVCKSSSCTKLRAIEIKLENIG